MPSQPSSPIRRTMSVGKAPRTFVLVDDRRDLGHHEVADRVAKQHVLRGEVEVHPGERTTGTARPRMPVLACRHARLDRQAGARHHDRRSQSGTLRAPGTRPSGGPSSLRRELLLRLRLDGPSSPDQLAERLGRKPDRRPPAASRARGREPRHPPDGPPRCRPATPPLRRHSGRPGPVPVELRRAGIGPAGRHRGGRWRRPPRPGLRRPSATARRPGPRTAWRIGWRPTRRSSSASANSPSSRPTRATSPDTIARHRRHDPAARAQLRDLPHRRGLARGLPGRARAVHRDPRRGRRPRVAHRLGRSLLHLSDRGATRRLTGHWSAGGPPDGWRDDYFLSFTATGPLSAVSLDWA